MRLPSLAAFGVIWLCACSNTGSSDSLILAARDGDEPGVRAAIRAGVHIDACGSWEGCDTALELAAAHDHLDVVKILVESGALLNSTNPTPLYVAADFGHLDVVEYLQGKGASLGKDEVAIRKLRDKLLKRNERGLYHLLFGTGSSGT